LLGLYQGVPTTKQNIWQAHMPEVITLYQGPIERYCLFSPARIQHQVRATLLHEIAHHFGMDHDEMPIWVKC
jgi:predicted Zn-dependent protease with MMP-like domain